MYVGFQSDSPCDARVDTEKIYRCYRKYPVSFGILRGIARKCARVHYQQCEW